MENEELAALRATLLEAQRQPFAVKAAQAVTMGGDPPAQAVTSSPSPDEALAIAREISAAAGLDPDIYVGLDVASDTPYADDESLSVVFPKGRPRRPAEVSFLLDRLRNETITRVRVIFAPELRDAMREALIR